MSSPRHRPNSASERPDPNADQGDEGSRDPGGLVVVQERVLGEIAHELGNFFHKLYYWSDFIKGDADGPKKPDSTVGHMLERTIANLEEFLKVALEYFHPITPNFTRISAGVLLDGFLTQVRALPEGESLEASREDSLASATVLVDLPRLSQAFRIVLQHLREDLKAGGAVVLHFTTSDRREIRGLDVRLEFEPKAPTASVFRVAEAGVEWAVAGKLIELHGGEIAQRYESDGRKIYSIFLPVYL